MPRLCVEPVREPGGFVFSYHSEIALSVATSLAILPLATTFSLTTYLDKFALGKLVIKCASHRENNRLRRWRGTFLADCGRRT